MSQHPQQAAPKPLEVTAALSRFGVAIVPEAVAMELVGHVTEFHRVSGQSPAMLGLAIGAGLIAQRVVNAVQAQIGPPPADGSEPPEPPAWAIRILAEVGSTISKPKTGPVDSREELVSRAKAAGIVLTS